MLRKSDNIFRAIIAEGTVAPPTAAAIASPATIAKGAVAITDLAGKVLTNAEVIALSATDRFVIVQGKGATEKLMKTCPLTKGELTITPGKYAAAVQQVTAVGFNGTTGSLPSANSTDYWIRIKKNDNNGRDNSQGTSLFAGPVKTDASATQEELAFLLVLNGLKEVETDPYVMFEALSDEAGVAVAAGSALNLIFTKGSAEVKGSANNVAVTNVSVGDLIKVAAATTSAVYKVKSTTAATGTTPYIITLTCPFQAESITVAKADARRITAADAAASEMGVRITGVENAFNVNTFRNYYANRFTANFFGGTATLTSLTGAKNGTGVWQQAAMDEYMTYGFEGQGALGTPPTTRDAEVIKDAKYGVVEISWKSSMNYLVSNGNAEGTVLLYAGLNGAGAIPATTSAGFVADALGDIAVPAFTAATALV